MKSLITVLFLSLIFTGCYKEQSTTGIYKVNTETSAEIYYTDGKGDTQKVVTSGVEWVYEVELKQDSSPDPFYFNVYVLSDSGIQDISIYAEFEESNRDWYTISESDVEELEYNSAYCTPWTTKCAKVTINF